MKIIKSLNPTAKRNKKWDLSNFLYFNSRILKRKSLPHVLLEFCLLMTDGLGIGKYDLVAEACVQL